MTERDAHVVLCGLRQDQRIRIWQAARAVRDAKNDRDKRQRADRDLKQVLRYYTALGVLSEEAERAIYYALCRNGI